MEVTESGGATEFRHNGPIWANVGNILGMSTVTLNVVVVAHCPAFGVKE